MAAGEGFEPSHTESESAVLPLHNPAMRRILYPFFALCQEKYFGFPKRCHAAVRLQSCAICGARVSYVQYCRLSAMLFGS